MVSEKRVRGRNDEDGLGHTELGIWAEETDLRKRTVGDPVG